MNWSRFQMYRSYRLTPPAMLRMPDGRWERRDWEWFAQPSDPSILSLAGPNTRRGKWVIPVGRDNFHSFQSGHLLLRGQLYLFDHGPGFRISPFRADCREVTEALLNRIRELLASDGR